jgi:hypothetical protein
MQFAGAWSLANEGPIARRPCRKRKRGQRDVQDLHQSLQRE